MHFFLQYLKFCLLNIKFNQVYPIYLNLDRRPDRKEHIENELNKSLVLKNLYERFSAIEAENVHNNTRIEWIEDDFKVAKQKLEAIEAEMRVLLGDPFAEDVK